MEYKKFEGSVNVILGDYPRSAANPKAREILKSIGWDSTKYDQMRTFQSHHRRFKQNRYKYTKFYNQEFIAIDGEGYTDETGNHKYFLFANSEGDYIFNPDGLPTDDCLKFIIDTASYGKQIIIYGGSYDLNKWLKDVDISKIYQLQETNKCVHYPYIIECVPRKYFSLKLLDFNNYKNEIIATANVWDCLGFFQQKFTDTVEQYLDIDSDSMDYLRQYKDGRSEFDIEDFDNILRYCQLELDLLVKVMTKFKNLCVELELSLTRYDGAGALATAIYRKNSTKQYLNREIDILETSLAYSGGWIEPPQQGRYLGKVYKYDIRSAYPSVMVNIPSLKDASLQHVDYASYHFLGQPEIIDFALYKVHFKDNNKLVYPLFHRYKDNIYHPQETIGWHYGSEIKHCVENCEILEAYIPVIRDDTKPFSFIQDYYDKRMELKKQGNIGEKVLKLGINSLYGKTAQTVGWKIKEDKLIIPTYHQLWIAGYITASTRGQMWKAIKNHTNSIIGIETDGIFSTEPLDVELGEGLGQWELETYDEIVYIQSGVYWLRKGDNWYTKNRGLDTGALILDDVLEAYKNINITGKFYVEGKATSFITYGSAMSSHTWLQWGQWVETTKQISLIPEGKRRLHDDVELSDYDKAYDKLIPSLPKIIDSLESEPYKLDWFQESSLLLDKVEVS